MILLPRLILTRQYALFCIYVWWLSLREGTSVMRRSLGGGGAAGGWRADDGPLI